MPGRKLPQDPHQDLLLAVMAGADVDREPPALVRQRLRQELLDRIPGPKMHVVRADEGGWRPLFPGISIKTLRRDEREGSETTLWRIEPGAKVPPHLHLQDEECLILAGSVFHGGIEYFTGDYLLAEAGLKHQAFISPGGAMLMIRGEPVPSIETLARLGAI